MTVLCKREWVMLAFIVVYSLVPVAGGFIRILELAGGPAIAPPNPRALADPLPIVLHIVTSVVFCIAGAIQFLPSFRRSHRNGHRMNGRVVAAAGRLSAATGLWMTHVYTFPAELQGSLLYCIRMVLGSGMIGLIVWAVLAIRKRDTVGHSSAMLRAYAIGQGRRRAVLGITWIAFTESEAMGPMREGIMTFAWVLNLLIAQFLIRRLPKTGLRKVGQTLAQHKRPTIDVLRIKASAYDPY